MIEQFRVLRNIGQFDSVTPSPQTTLRKMALIYAENGRGKTTLANILRSLGTNNAVPIVERHRLGAPRDPQVVINGNGQTYTFERNTWSGTPNNIAVFDDHFVAQNVCSGIEIETGHKQNLYELILGTKGVALNATLQTHIDKVEEHNRTLRIKEAAIPAAERGTLTVDAFCALSENVNIDAEIQTAERNLAACRTGAIFSPTRAKFSRCENRGHENGSKVIGQVWGSRSSAPHGGLAGPARHPMRPFRASIAA
jgi:hypothetical protein